MAKPNRNPKIHIAKAWAAVSPRGKISTDAIHGERDQLFLSEWMEDAGYKIKRVTVVFHSSK